MTPPDFLQAKSKTTSRNFLTFKKHTMALRGSLSCQQEQKCPEFKASGSRNRRERTKRRSPGPHLFIFIASMCSAQRIGSGW